MTRRIHLATLSQGGHMHRLKTGWDPGQLWTPTPSDVNIFLDMSPEELKAAGDRFAAALEEPVTPSVDPIEPVDLERIWYMR